MARALKSKKLLIFMCVLAVTVAIAGVVGCAPKANPGNPTPSASSPTTVPAKNEFGVIGSDAWESQYPNQYRTFFDNNENAWPEGKHNYLELYPEMVTLGKGYGYAKFFTEAGGHTYSMYTVTNNGRIGEKTQAGCLACKTPDVHMKAAAEGVSVWREPFAADAEATLDGITCANCHNNEDPSQLSLLRADWIRALGPEASKRSLSGEVCGQCHCDYSMSPTTGEPTSPYDSVGTMTPDNALAWYDEHGYVDWTYASTGAKMISVRHSEYEYCYGGEGNHMTQLGYDCADCHMPVETAADGSVYHSHYWQSPLDNEELIKNNCSTCHADLKAEMKAIEEKIDGRTHQIGMRAANFVKNFEEAVAAGTLSDDDLERLRYIQRAAAFYWNSAFAENSEGMHNPDLYTHVLDRAEMFLDEGDGLLGVESSADKFVSEYDPSKDYTFSQTPEEYYATHKRQ